MEDDNYEDLFQCPICLEDLSSLMLLSCGHSLCETCLNKILKKENPECSICKKKIEKDKIVKNEILNIIINFYAFLKNCTDVFLNFPLRFKYCVDCNVFITNYSFKKHKSEKHNLFSFEKVLQYYIEGRENVFDKDMFKVLYFYLNPFLHEIKYLNNKGRTYHLANNKYVLYGKMTKGEENKSLLNLMKNKYTEQDCIKWFRGTIINRKRKNSLFIHGYFLIKSIEGEPYIQPIIFGFLNYIDIKFFGFIRINKENINKKDNLTIENFFFDCGILFKDNYYIGKFNEINLSYFEKNKENVDSKLMLQGEILYVKDQGIEVKTIKPQKLGPEIPKIQKQLSNNKLSINTEFNKEKTKIEIEPFYIQKNGNQVIQTFDKYLLENCKINFINFNRTIILSQREYALYIFKDEVDEDNQINKYKTKVIQINLKDDALVFIQIKTSIIKNIFEEKEDDKSNLYYLLKKLLGIKVQNCEIKCFISDISKNDIILNKDIYYEISGYQVICVQKYFKNEKDIIHIDQSLKGIDSIEDFFKFELNPKIYNFKEKRKIETIACSNACQII